MIPRDADTHVVTKAPSPVLRIAGAAALLVVALWLGSGLVSEPDGGQGPETPALADITSSTTSATTTKPAALAAQEMLRENPGIGMTLCNAQTKHFDDTPEQVERARRYADCLADFGIPLRLPTATIHQAYAIPQDLEPSVVLRCGHHLTGPDVSTAAYRQFEVCASEAEILFGITRVTS